MKAYADMCRDLLGRAFFVVLVLSWPATICVFLLVRAYK